MTVKLMSRASDDELREYFESKVEHLVDYIRTHWNWKGLKPKRFKALCDDNDNDALRERDEKIKETFTGLADEYGASCAFHRRTAPWMTAFDQVDQGRDPLEVLIQSAVTWGAHLEMESQKRNLDGNSSSESNKKYANMYELILKATLADDKPFDDEKKAKIMEVFQGVKRMVDGN